MSKTASNEDASYTHNSIEFKANDKRQNSYVKKGINRLDEQTNESFDGGKNGMI